MSTLRTSATSGKGRHLSGPRTSAKNRYPSDAIIDKRHTRVRKACERCRVKKAKCDDGEWPCKRCKEHSSICIAGSRRKNESKQLPQGYVEVLENVQHVLIATVQKLYAMVRNNESWEMGEPNINDRKQPVIHSIAEKLGCLRPSPDLPYGYPGDADEFADLQQRIENYNNNSLERKSYDYPISSSPPRDEHTSSSESYHSDLSNDHIRMIWTAQQELRQQQAPSQAESPHGAQSQGSKVQLEDEQLYVMKFKQELSSIADPIGVGEAPALSAAYLDFQNSSPFFCSDSLFNPWSEGDDFLGPSNMLDLKAIGTYANNNNNNAVNKKQQLSAVIEGWGGDSKCFSPRYIE